jgi:CSLREA domain-containing protein
MRSISLFTALLMLLVMGNAFASDITVDTTDDELNSDGDCSLREAVEAANTNAAVDACVAGSSSVADNVLLPAGTYSLTGSATDEDNNAEGDLDVLGSVNLVGDSAKTVKIVQGATGGNVIELVSAGTYTIRNLTLTGMGNGANNGEYAGVTVDSAASIVTIEDVAFTAEVQRSSSQGVFSPAAMTTVERCLFDGLDAYGMRERRGGST